MRPNRVNERPPETIASADRVGLIDRLLPQTQCRRCGYDGCRPYAEAVATGGAAINRCPPGGSATISALARLLAVPEATPDPACGAVPARSVAAIDNTLCIGCTKCILACPVDAIVGAPKHQHHVLADRCTGCELCLAPCPVDCISMQPLQQPWSAADAEHGRSHHRSRLERLATDRPTQAADPASRDPLRALSAPAERARRLSQILARAQQGGAS
jgi:electron transport complex protein RnfB